MAEKAVILVVDDDPPILTLMRALLSEFGFDALTAMSGAEAIGAARETRPDLVLLDMNMPGMTGEEVIAALRSESGFAELPILILSGERVDTEEIVRLGVNGAVQKPFDVVALIARIREQLRVRA